MPEEEYPDSSVDPGSPSARRAGDELKYLTPHHEFKDNIILFFKECVILSS